MADNCKNCGAELFPGQRFCRNCGRPTDTIPEENVPTRMMPPDAGATGFRPAANTAQPQRPQTSPVWGTPPAYYQPPGSQVPVPPYPQQRQRSPWGWIIALVLICMFGAGFLGVLIFSRSFNRPRPNSPPAPPPAAEMQQGEQELSDQGATVSAKETVITKRFSLNGKASVTIHDLSGNIVVEGWDRPQAEVKVIKRGGSAQDRKDVKVRYTSDEDSLSLRTAPTRGNNIDVEYQVKLPRNLGEVHIEGASSSIKLSDVNAQVSVTTQSGAVEMSEINGEITVNTQSGTIKLSKISGEVAVDTKSGSVEITDLNGGVRSETLSGSTKVVFENVVPGAPLEFHSVSGSVQLEFKSDLNADLEARTVSGEIDLSDIGIDVERSPGRQEVNATIGTGGQPLSIETVSGNIKIIK